MADDFCGQRCRARRVVPRARQENQWGNISALRREDPHRTDQGEGKDHALRRVLSLPLDPHSLSALGWGCLRRTGALPLTPTKGSAPGPRLGLLP